MAAMKTPRSGVDSGARVISAAGAVDGTGVLASSTAAGDASLLAAHDASTSERVTAHMTRGYIAGVSVAETVR
jgi:hypothetical protein